MNIIGHIDPSAFRTAPRMHHRLDESTPEFPSSAGSRARGLMALKACNWMAARGGGWENPYVTDGLMSYFDGEWNTEGGVRDELSSKWMNLANPGQWIDLAGTSWGDKFLHVDGTQVSYANENLWAMTTVPMTIEILCKVETAFETATIFGGSGDGTVNASQCLNVTLNGGLSLSRYRGMSMPDEYKVRNAFIHIAGTTENKMYCFGNEVQPTGSTSIGQGNPLGAGINCGVRITNYWKYVGDIYVVRAYNRALTAAEVAANYAVDKARFGLT